MVLRGLAFTLFIKVTFVRDFKKMETTSVENFQGIQNDKLRITYKLQTTARAHAKYIRNIYIL